MSGINGLSNVSSMTAATLGSSGSLQFQFAALQLALSQMSKNSALDYMENIQKSQDEQKALAQMLQSVRQAQTTARENNKSVTLPGDTLAYMKSNGLALPTPSNQSTITNAQNNVNTLQKEYDNMSTQLKDLEASPPTEMTDEAQSKHMQKVGVLKQDMDRKKGDLDRAKNDRDAIVPQFSADSLDTVVESLQAKLDTIGTDTQQLMIYVQDFMGQYNSYLQGSNSVIQQANTTLAELARAR